MPAIPHKDEIVSYVNARCATFNAEHGIDLTFIDLDDEVARCSILNDPSPLPEGHRPVSRYFIATPNGDIGFWLDAPIDTDEAREKRLRWCTGILLPRLALGEDMAEIIEYLDRDLNRIFTQARNFYADLAVANARIQPAIT